MDSTQILDNDTLLPFSAILGVVALVTIILTIILYIFQSIGLYSIAKRRGIPAPGLAWVPMLNMYMLGKIADRVQLGWGAAKSCLRKWILGLSIVLAVLSFISRFIKGAGLQVHLSEMEHSQMVGFLILLFIRLLFVIALMVLEFIALFHVFRSCSEKYVCMLVLSIIFVVLMPIFLFAVRKKDRNLIQTPEAVESLNNEQP